MGTRLRQSLVQQEPRCMKLLAASSAKAPNTEPLQSIIEAMRSIGASFRPNLRKVMSVIAEVHKHFVDEDDEKLCCAIPVTPSKGKGRSYIEETETEDADEVDDDEESIVESDMGEKVGA